MVDVLSARMQAVYTKWDQGSKSPPTRKVSANTLRRYGPAERREKFRNLSADSLQQFRDRELYRTKESPWNLGFPPRPSRPVMGSACKACTPDSKDFLMDYSDKNQDVQNILKTDTESSGSFLARRFCHIVHTWKLKKYDFPQVSDKVLMDSRFRDAIEDTTKEMVQKTPKDGGTSTESNGEDLYKQILTTQEARAKRILMDMRSTLSDFLLRRWGSLKKTSEMMVQVTLDFYPTKPHPLLNCKTWENSRYPGKDNYMAFVQTLSKIPHFSMPSSDPACNATKSGKYKVAFDLCTSPQKPLGLHSYHFHFIEHWSKVASGCSRWLLRGLGAFFIKRRIDPVAGRKDILYRAVLHTYMIECLRAGHNIEFYIEGGRTRTGKPCMPKGGLLSVIVGAYMDGTVEDALLVPVSVNYDKLVDGNFVRELLGQPKQMETFSSALSAIWTTLNSNYGSMRIDFNQPFSLRELVKSFQNMSKSGRLSQTDFFSGNESESSALSKKNGFQKEKSFRSIPSTTSLYGTDVVDEDHRALVDKIARHLVYDCTKACAVMSTNTLAFLLLNKYREGVSIKDLVMSFDKLRQQLSSDNRDVGYSGESLDVIIHAIRLLGPDLVKREKKTVENSSEVVDFITPITSLPNVIELSYYSNALLPHFMVEGVVATSICCSVKSDSLSHLTITMDEIMRNAMDLCDILQFEFIFAKPCESLEYVISEIIDKFKYMDILSTEEPVNLEYENWSQKVAKSLDDSEEDEFYQYKPSPTYIISNSKDEEEKLELFHMTLRPLVDTYMAAAMCLHTLVDKQVPENEFLEDVLAEIKSQLNSGYCSYGESSSVEPIKNALKLFKKWGVIEMYNQDSVKLVYLTDAYNSEEDVQPVIKKIGHFKFIAESLD